MHRLTLLAALVASLGLILPAQGAGKDKPVRVLLVLGSPDWHDVRALAPHLEKMLGKAGGFKVTTLMPPKDKPTNDAAHLAKLADLKRADYDVVVFYTDVYKTGDLPEKAVVKFVEDGGGLVALHGTTKSFIDEKTKAPSPTWQELLGAKCDGHIKGLHKLNIEIVDKTHPITKGIEPFTITDQEFRHTLAKVKRHLLCKFKERPAESDQKLNMDIVWTRDVGKGRVAYIALGHDKEAWDNPSWQKLTLQAIAWAAGQPREIKVAAASK